MQCNTKGANNLKFTQGPIPLQGQARQLRGGRRMGCKHMQAQLQNDAKALTFCLPVALGPKLAANHSSVSRHQPLHRRVHRQIRIVVRGSWLSALLFGGSTGVTRGPAGAAATSGGAEAITLGDETHLLCARQRYCTVQSAGESNEDQVAYLWRTLHWCAAP